MPAKISWLNCIPNSKTGTSFGVAWPKSEVPGDVKSFLIQTESGETFPIGSRPVSYWPDGSLKWTSHDWTGDIPYSETYNIVPEISAVKEHDYVVDIEQSGSKTIVTNNVGLKVEFDLADKHQQVIGRIVINGKEVSSGAVLIASINDSTDFTSVVDSIKVENRSFSRALIKVSGHLVSGTHKVFPFDTRIYVYSGSKSIQVMHSFVYDLQGSDLLRSLGLKFIVPFGGAEMFNRHVRLSGSDIGILREEVQGLTGLWKEVTQEHRTLQSQGKTVSRSIMSDKLQDFLGYVPTWDTYSLTQLSSDGFEIKKRTKVGNSQVKVIAGTRSSGTAYIGSSDYGGLAVGLRDFWERYPTQIELANLTKSNGEITMWLYSPLAEPMEMSPYHDGLGKHSYKEQLEGLSITYEDWEGGFANPEGIARTFQLVVEPYDNQGTTPSNGELALVVQAVRSAPKLLTDLVYLYSTGALGRYWSPDFHLRGSVPGPNEKKLEEKLDSVFGLYEKLIEQNRWYGFWDYGDVQHTYDPYKNAWRYDVGGFAWDNSELSTDLWLWLYFLHTGRKDVFKVAEAMTRHTGEVDVYHSGRFKRFGTRHGVQHFSDSAKQVRISNVLYRRFYYFLTTDERIGDLLDELIESELAIQSLDSHRKVLDIDHSSIPEGYAPANIGLDSAALLEAWLTAWERRKPGWQSLRDKIVTLADGIGSLKYGIATNEILLNIKTGQVLECKPPMPEYSISHLSMLFGFQEIISEVLEALKDDYPKLHQKLLEAYLKYSRAYNGTAEQQIKEYGFKFPPSAGWHQSHSTNTADAAVYQKDKNLALAAWEQFFNVDGLLFSDPLTIEEVSPPQYFSKGIEAKWVTTNQVARFGVSAVHNLARVGEYIEQV